MCFRVFLPLLLGLWFVSPALSSEVVWYDSVRHRAIPVKIYFPQTTAPAPVILFSHGIGSSIDNCAYLADAWTAHGFVCVLVQHPGCDENIWKGKIRVLNEFRGAFEQNWNGRTRAEDLRFVLNCIEQLVQSHPQFAARMDMERVGVGGIDLGALAALLLAGQVPPDYGYSLYDPRVKAVLALSPPVRPMNISFREVYRPITAPTLFITGTNDDGVVGQTKATQRRIPFDAMVQNQRYLITLEGGGHRMYGGRVVSVLGGRNSEKFQTAIVRSSTVFWRAFLHGDPAAMQVMNTHGWSSLVGVQASIERRSSQVATKSGSGVNNEIGL